MRPKPSQTRIARSKRSRVALAEYGSTELSIILGKQKGVTFVIVDAAYRVADTAERAALAFVFLAPGRNSIVILSR